MGGDWRPAGRGQEAVRTRRAGTKRKSREAACGTPGRAQKEAPPTPAIDGRPTTTPPRPVRRPLVILSNNCISAVRPDGSQTRNALSERRQRCGVRAQLCLAGVPPRQAGRARCAVKTNMRSLSAPAAGSERPSETALLCPGASRGRRAPAEGARTDAGCPSGEGFPLAPLRTHRQNSTVAESPTAISSLFSKEPSSSCERTRSIGIRGKRR